LLQSDILMSSHLHLYTGQRLRVRNDLYTRHMKTVLLEYAVIYSSQSEKLEMHRRLKLKFWSTS